MIDCRLLVVTVGPVVASIRARCQAASNVAKLARQVLFTAVFFLLFNVVFIYAFCFTLIDKHDVNDDDKRQRRRQSACAQLKAHVNKARARSRKRVPRHQCRRRRV